MWCSSARLDELLNVQLEEQLGELLDDQLEENLAELLKEQPEDQLGVQLKDQLGDQLEVQLDDEDNLQRRKVFSRGLGELTRKILYLTHVLVMLGGCITEDLS